MLLLRNIAQIVTLRGGPIPRVGASMSDLGIIENGAVLIRGDRIVWVGPTKDLPVREPGIRYQTLDGMGLDLVALPGFVDSHTHPVFAGTRVEEYDLNVQGRKYEEGGIAASVRQLRAATVNQLIEKAERYFRHFLSHGTTTIEAKSGYGLSLEDELKSLQVLAALRGRNRLEIIPTFMGAHAVPEERAGSRADYIREIIEEMIPRVAQEGLASFCDVSCERGYFTVEESRAILTAAKQAGLGIRIHTDEFSRSGGARLAAELGASSADHLQCIDDSDIEALKRSGTVATLLPGTAFNLGMMRYPPARKLIAAEVPVALATDFNPGTCFTLNMQLILAIACTQMRMSPAEAITAATINSAYSWACPTGSGRRGRKTGRHSPDGRFRLPRVALLLRNHHCVVTIKKGNVVINRLEQPWKE